MSVAVGGNSMYKGPGAGTSSACFWNSLNSLKAGLVQHSLLAVVRRDSVWPSGWLFSEQRGAIDGCVRAVVTTFAFCKDPSVTCLVSL